LGGELIFSDKVTKIKIKDNKVTGVELEKGELRTSRYVISNADARQTFLTLLGRKAISHDFREKILNMKPSLSMFILYLGLKNPGEIFQYPGVNMWFLSHYNLDDIYSSFERGELKHVVMVRMSPDMKSMLGFVNTAFKNKKYWDTHKASFMESFISMIEKKDFPELSKHIIYKDAATPFTLNRYTLNYKGAAYGWACTPSQIAISDFRKSSTIHGLYFAGHWTTQGLGIPGVTYSGYDTAKTILRKEKKYI
jgi:phytoene dehydrogenase-like protein